MARFAEEIGLVGGDHINQMNDFVALSVRTENKIGVFLETPDSEGFEAFLETGLQHGLLGRRHLDANLVIDECAEPVKLPIPEECRDRMCVCRVCPMICHVIPRLAYAADLSYSGEHGSFQRFRRLEQHPHIEDQ